MADTQTLPLTQPKKEIKRNQIQGLFEDTVELIVGGEGTFVNERPVSAPDFEQIMQMPEHKAGGFPSTGTIENFQQPDLKKVEAINMKKVTEALQNARAQNYQHKETLTIEDMARYGLAGASNQQLAKEGNYQENYEGESLRSIYNLVFVFLKRIGEAIKEQMKSSKPFEIRQERAGRATSTKGAVSGAGDLLRDFENRNITWNAG